MQTAPATRVDIYAAHDDDSPLGAWLGCGSLIAGRLVVPHRRLPDRQGLVGVASGWHAHLGILEDLLNDDPPRGFWSTHTRLAAEYDKRIAGE